jgi:hypothetical protein
MPNIPLQSRPKYITCTVIFGIKICHLATLVDVPFQLNIRKKSPFAHVCAENVFSLSCDATDLYIFVYIWGLMQREFGACNLYLEEDAKKVSSKYIKKVFWQNSLPLRRCSGWKKIDFQIFVIWWANNIPPNVEVKFKISSGILFTNLTYVCM